MTIRYLLKSQANAVFQSIAAAGLDPSQFEWRDFTNVVTPLPVSQLVHKSTGYYFSFNNADGFMSVWSPAVDRLVASEDFYTWEVQLEYFRRWLTYLEREVESPDLWGAIATGDQLLESATSADTSNSPFTAEEKQYVLNGLEEIKQYLLSAHKLDQELVESRLRYLIESSDRVGRKDWLNLLLSILFSIVINAALPPESSRELFQFVGTVLREILLSRPLLLT